MDLSVLHPVKSPERDYARKDKLNSLTGPLECRFLEWTGWYNQDIYQRLFGHYRLYQVFKKECNNKARMPLSLAYTVNYRASHGLKYLLSNIIGILYFIGTFGKRYGALQTERFNKVLIKDHASILYEFLIEAEQDAQNALLHAVQKINAPEFGTKPPASILQINQVALTVQNNIEATTTYHNSSHYFNEYTTISAANGIKGKEKGVFSKKQILIFLDLLAETGKIEKIDFTKPNKFVAVGELLYAISGKSKDSWVEQLKDSGTEGLYDFKSDGDRKQLIVVLINLSNTLKNAGFRSIAKNADKKILELEKSVK